MRYFLLLTYLTTEYHRCTPTGVQNGAKGHWLRQADILYFKLCDFPCCETSDGFTHSADAVQLNNALKPTEDELSPAD